MTLCPILHSPAGRQHTKNVKWVQFVGRWIVLLLLLLTLSFSKPQLCRAGRRVPRLRQRLEVVAEPHGVQWAWAPSTPAGFRPSIHSNSCRIVWRFPWRVSWGRHLQASVWAMDGEYSDEHHFQVDFSYFPQIHLKKLWNISFLRSGGDGETEL